MRMQLFCFTERKRRKEIPREKEKRGEREREREMWQQSKSRQMCKCVKWVVKKEARQREKERHKFFAFFLGDEMRDSVRWQKSDGFSFSIFSWVSVESKDRLMILWFTFDAASQLWSPKCVLEACLFYSPLSLCLFNSVLYVCCIPFYSYKRPVNCVKHTHTNTQTQTPKWIQSVNVGHFSLFLSLSPCLSVCLLRPLPVVLCVPGQRDTQDNLLGNLFPPPLLSFAPRAFDCLAKLQVSLSPNSLSLFGSFSSSFFSLDSLTVCHFLCLSLALTCIIWTCVPSVSLGPRIPHKQWPYSCLPLEQFNQWQ